MKALIQSQRNVIDTLNNYNNQYVCVPTLYNLPDDEYIREYLYNFEEGKCDYMPSCVKRFLRSLPLAWLSQITSKYGNYSEDILIINDCNLPDSIKQYVKSYYVKFHNYSDKAKNRFSTVIHPNIEKDSRECSLSDYLKVLDKQNENSFCVGSYVTHWKDDIWYHIFDGITLNDFYKIYFKSGLSKEIILRYLKDTEFTYSVDNQEIKKQVEEILNKH